MNCAKCGGLWFEDAEDSRCLNCGARDTSKAVSLTAEEIMETIKKNRSGNYRGRKPGSKNKPKDTTVVQPAPPRTRNKPFNPFSVLSADHMVEEPEPSKAQTNGHHHAIDEHHPFVQVLAAKWEELDQEIDRLKDKQALLKELMDQAQLTI